MSNNHTQRDLQLQQQTRDAGFARPDDIKRGEVVEVNGSIQGNLPYLIWVRPLETNASPIQMFNPGVVQNLQAGMTVYYRQDPEAPAPWSLVRFDNATYAQDAATFLSLPGANNPPHAAEHIMAPGHVGPDPLNVYGHAIVDFAVRPTRPASMRVRVHSGWYPGATNYELFKGPVNTKDFTSDVPAAAGKARLVAICVDKAGVLTYVNGSEFTEGEPIPAAARPQVSTQLLLITAIRLVNGMTAISNEHFDHEMRPVFAPGGLSRSLDAARVSRLVSPDGLIEPVLATDNNGDLTMQDGAAGDLLFIDRSAGITYFGRTSIPAEVAESSISHVLPAKILQVSEGPLQNVLYVYGSNAQLRARRIQGTIAAPTAQTTGNVSLRLQGGGYDGTTTGGGGDMSWAAAENWTATNHGSDIFWRTVPLGSITQTERMRLDNAGLLDIYNTTAQLRLSHTRSSVYAAFTVDVNHDLTIKPTSTGQIKLQSTTDSTDFFQVLDADGGTPILNVDATNEAVIVGGSSNSFTEEGTTTTSNVFLNRQDVGTHRGLVLSLDTSAAGRDFGIAFLKSLNGGAVATGNELGTIFFSGHDGTDFNRTARISAEVQGTVSANTVPTDIYFQTSETNSGGMANRMRIKSDGQVFIGNTTTSFGDLGGPGLGIHNPDQWGLVMRDTAVAHGLTVNGAETDVFLRVGYLDALSGGGYIDAYKDDDSNGTERALLLRGSLQETTLENYPGSTSEYGVVDISAAKHLGIPVNVRGAIASTEWILSVSNFDTARFFFRGDGTLYSDVDGTQTFDKSDDAAMLRTVAREIGDPAQLIRSRFDEFVRYNRADLIRAGLILDHSNGRTYRNITLLQDLLIGAVWQQAEKQLSLAEQQDMLMATMEKLADQTQKLAERIN